VALTNEILVGRFNGILTKLLGMKDTPAPVLMPEMTASVILENDRPEFAFLGGSQLGIGTADQGAVALETPHIELRNPDASNMIVVVEDVWVGGDVSLAFVVGLRRAAELFPGGTNLSTTRDSRQGITSIRTSLTRGTLLLPDRGREIAVGGVLARTTTPLKLQFVLAPGDALILSTLEVNAELKAIFRWYERHVDPGELR